MVNGVVPANWPDLVKQSEEHMDDAGNDSTKLWASTEFDPFHNDEDMDHVQSPDIISKPKTSTLSSPNEPSASSADELFMPTLPDLDELTCRRSKRERKTPERFDPSASTTIGADTINSHSMSIMFTMICLVTSGSLQAPQLCNTICSKAVYHTHLINQHFDGTMNYILPMAYATDIADNETYTFK